MVRARLATLIRYLSNDRHRLRMLAFIDDESADVATFVIQGLGHQSYSTTSDQAIRNGLGQELVAPGAGEDARARHVGVTWVAAIAKAKDAPPWQKTAARWWMEQGPSITS